MCGGIAMPVGPLDIPYLARVKSTPAPSTFGKIWTEYQFPPNGTDPLYNMGRPFQARVSLASWPIGFDWLG